MALGFTSKNTSESKPKLNDQTVIDSISQKRTSTLNKFDDVSSDELTMNKYGIKFCREENEQRYINLSYRYPDNEERHTGRHTCKQKTIGRDPDVQHTHLQAKSMANI